MHSQDAKICEEIRKKIKDYNESVKESKKYLLRKFIRSTPTIFFDSEFRFLPKLRWSQDDWCRITPELSHIFENGKNEHHIISFNGPESKKKLENAEFINQCKLEMPKLLFQLAEIYLGMNIQLTRHYSGEVKERVKIVIEKISKDLHQNIPNFMQKPAIILYIHQQIKLAKSDSKINIIRVVQDVPAETIQQKVLRMRSQKMYTVQNICDICKICKYTYYSICHIDDRPNGAIARPRGRPLNENSLNGLEIEFIKELVDTPERSYTVPEICEKIKEKFKHEVSKSKVYYQLTKKLRYSYKRNHFKPHTSFEPEQIIVRFEVCKKLIEIFKQGKNLIVIDETGFHLGVQREYSFAKVGKSPFRKRRNYVEKRHVIMAITNHNVFAYTISSKGYNEHSFCDFMISLCKKLHELGPETVNNSIFYADNASFHVSRICKKLLEILQIPILFSPVAACDYSPIESLFSIIKREFKKRNVTKQYFFNKKLNLFRKMLEDEIFHSINSIKPEIFLKLYIRILTFLEEGIREIQSIFCK